MFKGVRVTVNDINTEIIRYAFLKASYFELFGICPDSTELNKLTTKMISNGRQEP